MKVAIYCRLSDEDKNKQSANDDSESIQNQKTMLIDFAVKQDWEIFNIYSDDDYAGADRNRPAFKQLIENAEKKKFDIVLCKSQSRFTRELELVEKYIHDLFPRWGIRFVSIVDNADTNVKGNKKARQINGLINEWYLEDLSENIKSVFMTKKKQGKHIGAFALYGYKKDPNQKGHIIIDDEASKVVKEVFRLFSNGYGKTVIAKMLNDRGIPNPTEYKRLNGLRFKTSNQKNSTLWRYFSVADMLANEMYIGTMVQNKQQNISYKTQEKRCIPKNEWIRVPDTHEPIIDIELWNKVQELLKQKAKPFGDTGKIGLFAKKVKCMNCQYFLRSSKNHGDYYLQCATKHIAKGACVGAFISVKKLENVVRNELNQLISTYADTNQLERQIKINNQIEKDVDELKNKIDTFQKKFNEATEAVKSLYLDKTKGIITEDEFINFSKTFHDDKAKFQSFITAYQEDIERLEYKKQFSEDKSKILEEYIDIEKLERIHINTLVDFIEVGKKNPETKEIPIKIHWNF